MRGRAGWGGKKLLFLLYYLFSILGFESSLEVIIGNMLLNAIILTKVFFQYFFWVGIYVISIFHFLRFFLKIFYVYYMLVYNYNYFHCYFYILLSYYVQTHFETFTHLRDFYQLFIYC